MIKTTYTVLNTSGEPEAHNLSAWDAAQIVLSHDGHEFEVRRVSWGWQLFVSRGSRNSFGGWPGVPDVMTDADYDAMLAEIARDAE